MPSAKSNLIWFVILIVAFPLNISANPSDRNQYAPLDVHATIPEAKELVVRTYATKKKVWDLFLHCRSLENQASAYPSSQLMAAMGDLFQAIRDSRHLQQMGEPAGYDLEQRLRDIGGGINHLIVSWGNTLEGQKLKVKLDVRLKKSLPRLQKVINQSQQFLARNQLDAFESLMEKEGLNLVIETSPFDPITRNQYKLNFDEVLAAGDAMIAQNRADRYAQAARTEIEKNLEIAMSFQARGEEIRAELEGSLTNTDDPIVTIETAMSELLEAWGRSSAAVIRAHALEVAFNLIDSKNGNAPSQIQQALGNLTTEGIESYVTTIDMIAASQSPIDVRRALGSLLHHISVAQRRLGGRSDRLYEACQLSLEKMASLSPELPGQLAAYRLATDELMHWRSAFANASSAHLRKNTSSAAFLLSIESESLDPENPSGPKRITMVGPPSLNREASQIIVDAATRLIGKSVSGGPALRISSKTPLATIPFDGRVYAAVLLSPLADADLDHLRSDIGVTETLGPLSIHSAEAESAAEMQDFETIVGEIVGVTLESRLVRFATLPDTGYSLVPLGTLPILEDSQYPAYLGICWRLDVRSTIAQSKYFRVSKRQ
ncbi:hypothetical protein [Neorhodopirellula pilleata]|uniref:Uncharacterized protein n=1 Tax=Neorhodopirellula pilleata TaxID=2714738 RepID=A0A5C6ANU3_9BACT|nr:hypothetical protein [Neorhodopirellula pilleata]TWU01350.1 hypothetical protein Pla100_10770 [Neorhodopirellula pilleata]